MVSSVNVLERRTHVVVGEEGRRAGKGVVAYHTPNIGCQERWERHVVFPMKEESVA